MLEEDIVFKVESLRKYFEVNQGFLKSLVSKDSLYVHAVDDISFNTTGANDGDILLVVNASSTTGQLDKDGANMRVTSDTDQNLTQYDAVWFMFNGTDWIQIGAVNDVS